MTVRRLLESTLANALTYIESLDKTPVSATTSLADLRQRLGHQSLSAIESPDWLKDTIAEAKSSAD